MTDGVIHLRCMTIGDAPLLRKHLAGREALSYTELRRPVSTSWFRVWLKMKKIFDFAFMIDIDCEPVGFIGIYDLTPGQSAGISLVIFDRDKRGKGWGGRAFRLLAQNLVSYSTVRSLSVTYKSGNAAARSFWTKCGFLEKSRKDNMITLSRDLP
jgi:RimJ/RimL family protein N-acetyltransferase